MKARYYFAIPTLIALVILISGSMAHAERNISFAPGFTIDDVSDKYKSYYEKSNYNYDNNIVKKEFKIGSAVWIIESHPKHESNISLEYEGQFVARENWALCHLFTWC